MPKKTVEEATLAIIGEKEREYLVFLEFSVDLDLSVTSTSLFDQV